MDNNLNFSQRIGLTPLKSIQFESIDTDLRNRLWNNYQNLILEQMKTFSIGDYKEKLGDLQIQYFRKIWDEIFKLPVNEISYRFSDVSEQVRKYYFDENRKWNEIYDFIESSTNIFSNVFGHKMDSKILQLTSEYNKVLEREFSGYRFINGSIAPITNPVEIEGITNALVETGKFSAFEGSNMHLAKSLKFLSDKQNSDYRNSIKESISAVEAIVRTINGTNKDFAPAMDKIKDKLGLENQLAAGFKNLFNYTSGTNGIRHALMDASTCDFDDAKYMLVSCSAFINYLIAKSVKAKINFN